MDTLVSTDRLIEDAERAARQVRAERDFGMSYGASWRTALLDARNKLRARANELEGRLTKADEMYKHTVPDTMPGRYEEEWLRIEESYRKAYDAQQRATQALAGGTPQ